MTTDEKVKLFAHYYGCKCQFRWTHWQETWGWEIIDVDTTILDNLMSADFECQLIARHLSSITDAEAVQVAEAATGQSGWSLYVVNDEEIMCLDADKNELHIDIEDWSVYAISRHGIARDVFFTALTDTLRDLGFAEEWMFEQGLAIQENLT